jgi:hypothetical protein
VLLAITALALWLWATLGYAGLVGLAAIDFAVAFGIVRMIYARMRRDSTPFAQTMAAFLEDGKCLRNNS